MAFLRNSWYIAAWADTLVDQPRQIKILGETIALYRTEQGHATAIGGICPHRFASLAAGKVFGNDLECPYHGLRFDRTGTCAHNPHVPEGFPNRIAVASYPVVERYGAIWVWMGDASRADACPVPDLSLLEDSEYTSTRDCLHVKANYQLVADNLLDLSHVHYLHPFLTVPGFGERTEHEIKQDGKTVWSNYMNADEETTPLFSLLWDGEGNRGRFRTLTRWTAPSNILLDIGMEYHTSESSEGPTLMSWHLLTPETETTTHYFWTIGRNRKQADEALTAMIHEGIDSAFRTQDEPMIAQVAQNMEGRDFWDLHPTILPTDGAAIRARRLLAKMIKDDAPEREPNQPRAASDVAMGC